MQKNQSNSKKLRFKNGMPQLISYKISFLQPLRKERIFFLKFNSSQKTIKTNLYQVSFLKKILIWEPTSIKISTLYYQMQSFLNKRSLTPLAHQLSYLLFLLKEEKEKKQMMSYRRIIKVVLPNLIAFNLLILILKITSKMMTIMMKIITIAKFMRANQKQIIIF